MTASRAMAAATAHGQSSPVQPSGPALRPRNRITACSAHGTRAAEAAARGLDRGRRDRRASRRHGVRRRRGGRPLDRPGQGRRLRDGDQRRGRASTGCTPTSAAGSARPSRSSRPRIVGVDTVEFLGLPDGIVEYGVPLRRDAGRGDPPAPARDRDHRQLPRHLRAGRRSTRPTTSPSARAVLDAVRDAGNRWIFPEQLTDGLEPWGGVRAVWAFGSPEGRARRRHHRHLRRRASSRSQAHAAYIDGLGWENWDPREFLEGFGRQIGQRLGVAFGASAEVYSLTWGGDED